MGISLHSKHDVVVVGGGPTGIMAAVAAARNGADVLLIEQYGFLGGNATIGLALHTFHTAGGDEVIGGLPKEFIERLIALGGSVGPVEIRGAHMRTTTPVDHELLKYLVLEMVEEAGVKVLLHTFLDDVVLDGNRLRGIVVLNKSGHQLIEAECFVDCTGDADLAAKAGVPFEKGRPEDGLMQAATVLFKVGNVHLERVVEACGTGYALGRKPGEDKPIIMWFAAKLTPWNDLLVNAPPPLHPDYVFWGNSIHRGEANINASRLARVDGTNIESLTRAEWEGRRQVINLFTFLMQHVPGFENAHIVSTAPFVGIRETRRIIGEYVLTGDDVMQGLKFRDGIARGAYPIDIHDPKGKGVRFTQIGGDGSYDIPYRCLVPLSVDGLLVAGRSISTTHEAQGSVRVMIICMAMGQAAGTTAALAVKEGTAPRQVDIDRLRTVLRSQGANLGSAEVHAAEQDR